MPEILFRCQDTFLRLHNNWQHMLHRDTALLDHPAFTHLDLKPFFNELGKCDLYGAEKATALQADLLKFCAVYLYGGVFVDLDMFFIWPLDGFLSNSPLLTQVRSSGLIGECLIGAEKESPAVMKMIQHYRTHPANIFNYHAYSDLTNLAAAEGWRAYPTDFFCPHQRHCREEDRYRVTENTAAIHLFYRDFDYNLDRLKEVSKKARQGVYF